MSENTREPVVLWLSEEEKNTISKYQGVTILTKGKIENKMEPRVLWLNEYQSQLLYEARAKTDKTEEDTIAEALELFVAIIR